MGRPGAQVICSTGRFWSSHSLADILFCLPLSSSRGFPSASKSGTEPSRASTLLPGHGSRDGAKI